MSPEAAPALRSLLVQHAERVAVIVRHEARGLLRYETEEDLVQGVHVRALESGEGFTYQGDPAFFAWLRRTAENYLSDRRSYWNALKRRSGHVLRLALDLGSTQDGSASLEPVATSTGPSTFAARRERLLLVTRILDSLPPRDRDLVRGSAEGVPLEEQAARLGLSYEAAGKARQRALRRFRKAYALATGESLPPE